MSAQQRSRSTRRRKPAGRRWPLVDSRQRLRLLSLVVLFGFFVVSIRALHVQVIGAEAMAEQAAEQLRASRRLPAQRGSITDRNGQLLAFTEATVNVIADPKAISTNGKEERSMTDEDRRKVKLAPSMIANVVARHTGENAAEIEKSLLLKELQYVVLARQVSASTYTAIATELTSLKYDVGIYKEANPRRIYPMNSVASNVVGYLGDGKGAGGLEYALEKELAGKDGREFYQRSPHGKIPLGTQTVTPAQNGTNYQLTIDADLQWMAEKRLAQQVAAQKASWGFVIVQEVKTGRILVMANAPSFDSNNVGKSRPEDRGNRAVGSLYEPGSTMKVLTLSALMDRGITHPDDIVSIGGSIRSGEHEIRDAFKHGQIDLTTRGVLVKSSNIGTIVLTRKMDKATYADYLANYRLGVKTNLGLPGEAAGSVPKADMRDYTRDSVSFGTSLSVNGVQMASAVSAVANGGVYNAPTIIQSSTTADGVTKVTRPGESHRVVSAEASKQMGEMMEQMVLHYYDRLGIDGYRVSAKSGSAWGVNPKTGKYQGLVASVIGFAPTEDPQILVYTVLSKNDRSGAGLGIAGPVWKDVMSLALTRYGVQPSKNPVVTQYPLQKGEQPRRRK